MVDSDRHFPERLETARLVLRRALEADIDAYCRRIYGDADVMRTLPGRQPVALADARPRARSHLLAHWDEHPFGPWLVERVRGRRVIGHCGLRYWPGSHDVEVLYAFEPGAWGNGYAKEAARASVGTGFDVLGLTRIVGGILPGNHASEAVLRHLGMTPTGTLDLAATPIEMFEVTARTWRETGGTTP